MNMPGTPDYNEATMSDGRLATVFALIAAVMFISIALGGGWTAVSKSSGGLSWESIAFTLGVIASYPAAMLGGLSIDAIAIDRMEDPS